MMKAREKYQSLTSSRRMFLDMAIEAAELTLPYLITDDLSTHPDHKRLKQPWQSVGAKAVSEPFSEVNVESSTSTDFVL